MNRQGRGCRVSTWTEYGSAGAVMAALLTWTLQQRSQERWAREDALATDQDWVVAFWHHPPYTKGSHDSDSGSIESDMRENALPILEVGIRLDSRVGSRWSARPLKGAT